MGRALSAEILGRPRLRTRARRSKVSTSISLLSNSLQVMYSVFLGNYDDSDTDWYVVAHNTSESAGPDAFADPPDFAQSAGFVNESDSEEGYASEALGNSRPGPKPGGYDSRVEQLLYENPNLPILITEAGKGADGTKYIAYTIRTGVSIAFIP